MIQQADIDQLSLFHTSHFPGQPIPKLTAFPAKDTEEVSTGPGHQGEESDGLGYYEDGVKRTLTDEQIQMFRHSEIQRLLSERRAAREKEEKQRLKKEKATPRPGNVNRRKHRWADQPGMQDTPIEASMYDDVREDNADSGTTPKKFLWPKLGQHKGLVFPVPKE
ncbi:hypothetical protein HRR78_001450 [Exophiala dermatitidis]|nr:hypothetical protein HRR78_001450 [Exophiala dermatitidis]